uniref:Uncharacterized protein n=1 Tax=Timema genevievae TaxID=629358 RepID=A0A7R9K8D9_TIMGE|nr:unnamed protein product [Timema genevievae]
MFWMTSKDHGHWKKYLTRLFENKLFSDPKNCLLFFPPILHSSRKEMASFVNEKMGPSCSMLTLKVEGVIGTDAEDKVFEVEDFIAFSGLLLPAMPGVTVRQFHLCKKKVMRLAKGKPELSTEELQHLTGLPLDEEIKCLLLFCTRGAFKERIVYNLVGSLQNSVFQRGRVNFFYIIIFVVLFIILSQRQPCASIIWDAHFPYTLFPVVLWFVSATGQLSQCWAKPELLIGLQEDLQVLTFPNWRRMEMKYAREANKEMKVADNRKQSTQMVVGGGQVKMILDPKEKCATTCSSQVHVPHIVGLALSGDNLVAASKILAKDINDEKMTDWAIKEKYFPSSVITGFFCDGEIGLNCIPAYLLGLCEYLYSELRAELVAQARDQDRKFCRLVIFKLPFDVLNKFLKRNNTKTNAQISPEKKTKVRLTHWYTTILVYLGFKKPKKRDQTT